MTSVFNLLKRIDLFVVIPALLLTGFGLLMIYSASFDDNSSIFFKQLISIVVSLFVFLLISQINFNTLKSFAPLVYIVTLLLLIFTSLLGEEVRGSVRWIDIGIIKLQASELTKPALVLTLATFLANHSPKKLRNILISFLLVALPVFFILNQPDLGNALLLMMIWGFMIFVAGVRFVHIVIGTVAASAALPIIWNFLKDYQKVRVLAFLNPEADPQGASYNIVQALIALGSGQIFGKGLGRGTQAHLDFLPAESTDFIFAFIGEELGFLGIGMLIAVFAFLLYKLISIAAYIKNSSGSLFIFGAAFTILLQFFVNAGVNMAILPVTGITLPFVSFGGSSLVSFFALLGIVNSIENTYKEEKYDTVFDS